MQHSQRANPERQGVTSQSGTDVDASRPSAGRGVALEAKRNLRSPIAALRVLLEGTRAGGERTVFSSRALDEIERIEAAADDLIAWTSPRSTRQVSTGLGELIASLKSSLTPAERRRCHFLVENEETLLHTDAPLLVTGLCRSIRHTVRQAKDELHEIMVHAHAAEGEVTLSFIDTLNGADETLGENDEHGSQTPSLAAALLERDVTALGGSVSTHVAEGHRCRIVTLFTGASQ